MTNIAIVGAPTAGKSEFAKELADELDGGHVIIDGYADDVSKRVSFAGGPYANYLFNLFVATERYQRELEAYQAQKPRITVGTLVETAAYASLRGSSHAFRDREEQARVQVLMPMLGMLFRDSYRYDHTFYLPLNNRESEFGYLDEQIVDALGIFAVPYARLPREDRLKFALTVIEEGQRSETENETEETDQR